MTDTALATLTVAQNMLAAAETPADLKAVRDYAASAQTWAKARDMGIEAENQAAEIVLRAERAIGLILLDMNLHGGRLLDGRNPDGSPSSGIVRKPLEELGIGNWGSFQWQRLARMDEARFESLLAEHRAKGERIAKVNFYRDEQEVSRKRALKDLRDILADDEGATSVFTAFQLAANAMIEHMSQTPGDELPLIAGLIKRLYDEYVEVMRGA